MLIDNAYFNFPQFYTDVARDTGFKRYVEVGVYTGASVAFLAQELLKTGKEFELYAVDLWERAPDTGYTDLQMDLEVWNAFQERLRLTGTKDHVKVLKTDSISASKMFEDGSLDFVFIDANHSYEAVKADIEAWLPKLRKGGLIAGHDILEPSCGVERAVKDIFGSTYMVVNNCWARLV
jgi:predicted O-methyltransferase YrrM